MRPVEAPLTINGSIRESSKSLQVVPIASVQSVVVGSEVEELKTRMQEDRGWSANRAMGNQKQNKRKVWEEEKTHSVWRAMNTVVLRFASTLAKQLVLISALAQKEVEVVSVVSSAEYLSPL